MLTLSRFPLPLHCTVKVLRRCGLLALLAFVGGCRSRGVNLNDPSLPTPKLPPKVRPVVPSPVVLKDITDTAGIKFKHNSGAFGLKLYPETMGSGAAFIDFDGDGDQDIFFVNGRDWTPSEAEGYTKGPGLVHHKEYGFALAKQPPHKRTTGALYRNNGNGIFTDITAGSGLDVEMQGMGVAVGDYDNDGRPDLYVTSYGHNYLFHNEGHGKFKDVSTSTGVRDAGFGTSAMWVDYDRDGKLDLFVCRYIEWTSGTDIWNYGSLQKVNGGYLKTYAGPPGYSGQASHLYHNEGKGHFADVSSKAGIYSPVKTLTLVTESEKNRREAKAKEVAMSAAMTMGTQQLQRSAPSMKEGKSMGIALCDPNNDGWPDLLVTNDTVRNYLFINQKNGTFRETGVRSGVAYSPAGVSRAGMGVDVGDIDRSGRESIIIGNFDHEYLGLYADQGKGTFTDIAGLAEITYASTKFLTFGCLFLDVNNDGWLDIMSANGHVQDTINLMRRDLEYAERPQLFLNRGQQKPVKFDEIGEQCGPAMRMPRVARGIITGDIDLDGDLDVLLTINNGVPVLLQNSPVAGARTNNSLRLTLVGTKSNRSAIGATIEAHLSKPGQTTDKDTVVRGMVKSGSSYLSQSELPVTLGLGKQTQVVQLVIHWPSGKQTTLPGIAANQMLTIDEDKGIIRKRAFTH